MENKINGTKRPKLGMPDEEYVLIPMKLIDDKIFMWFSYCSAHQEHNEDCAKCLRGSWEEIFTS